MALLYIYLGSIVYNYGTMFLAIKALDKELLILGLEENKKNKNVFKSIISFIQYALITMIPIVNLVMPTYLIFNFDKAMKEIIEDGINDRSFIKIVEEQIVKEDNIKEADDKVITYNVSNELTNEEKIEFLKQELSRLTGKDITIKEKKGRQKRR